MRRDGMQGGWRRLQIFTCSHLFQDTPTGENHVTPCRAAPPPSFQLLPSYFRKHTFSKDVILWPAAGWRRFQSLPVFATEDANGRHRMLKYTPEHMHCLAAVWGPLAPPNTGVIAIQNPSNDQQVNDS